MSIVRKTLDGFLNLTARMGIGAQNLNSQGTYAFNLVTKNRVSLEAMYRGSWIVGAAVDSIAEDMTRAGITISGEMEPDRIDRLQAALTRTGIWGALTDSIKWSRLYGGAIAYIHIEGQDPATPLDYSTIAEGQFAGLKVYDRWQVQPDLNNLIQGGMDDGLPMFYDVVSDVTTGEVGSIRIHHSRAIRFVGIQLPAYQAIVEQLWGESVIERLYDRLIAFDTATSGASNLIQKAHLRTVGIDGLREILAAGGQAEENLLAMFSHMSYLQNNEGVTLLDKNDTFQSTQYTFAGLSDMILQFGQQISGALGIPLVRLFGQSPAGLSATGESDLRTYYDNVLSQQESRLREGLTKLLFVLHRSLFSESAPSSMDFSFTPLWQTSEKERSDIALVNVQAVVAAFDAGIIDQPTAMRELKQSSDTTGIFSNITDEQITEAEAMPPMPQVETMEPVTPPSDVV